MWSVRVRHGTRGKSADLTHLKGCAIMDNMLEFSVSGWGMTLSTAPLYINLSWGLTIVLVGAIIARKIVKVRRSK